MQVLTWHAARDLRVERREPPASPPRAGFARVAVRAAGVCGTDLSEYLHGPVMIRPGRPHPLTGQAPPVVLGHEFAGEVVDVGDGVDGVPVDQRVTADACWRCGTCFWCLRGDYHLCRIGASTGLHADGALAPLVDVPAYSLVMLPDEVDDAAGALVEPLAVGLHAIERAGLRAGERVGVVGFGPIGAAVSALCRAVGAGRLWVVEASQGRRRRAQGAGFEVLDPAGADIRSVLRAGTDGVGADVVFDCTGASAALRSSIPLARRGGRVVALGVNPADVQFPLNDVVLNERSVIGSIGYHHDLPRVVALLASGRLDVSFLVTDEVPLADAVAGAFDALAEDRSRHLKILVRP